MKKSYSFDYGELRHQGNDRKMSSLFEMMNIVHKGSTNMLDKNQFMGSQKAE